MSATVILDGMTHKVGPKGQVVLPKAMRDRIGIHPGDEVVFEDVEEGITVRKAESKAEIIARLRGSLPPSDLDPLEILMEEKRLDREREDRKFGQFP
ncbi:MAG TPA: AbrB/MazE/SpoVT family DNA-binding domain-containing protein [Conexibacter sp.]|nr:AbrB/MazE/SpoVT family DNA-binding domain-containing protein [Conexibacter sp.]